jgi:hypothetical protein
METAEYNATAFTRFMEAEIARWSPIARAAGVSAG